MTLLCYIITRKRHNGWMSLLVTGKRNYANSTIPKLQEIYNWEDLLDFLFLFRKMEN